MTTPTLEIAGCSIVLVGNPSPAAFQPSWFASQKLISDEEARAASIAVIAPQLCKFNTDWLQVLVTVERFEATTEQEPSFDRLRDLVLSTFQLMRNTPVHAVGLNSFSHFRMRDESEWHRLGHDLVPKERWGVLIEPGTRSVTVQGKRTDGLPGFTSVRVEPSSRVQPGVFVFVNDHFQLPDAPSDCDAAINVLVSQWSASRDRAEAIAQSFWGHHA